MRLVDEKVYVSFLQDGPSLESVDEMAVYLGRVRDAYALKHVNHVSTGIGFGDMVHVCGTFPEKFVDDYLRAETIQFDPVMKMAKLGVPVLWENVKPGNPIEAFVLKMRQEQIGRQAVTLPFSSIDESTSILTFVAEDGDDWTKRIPVLVREFNQIGQVLHKKALDLQGLSPPSIQLSTRHIDVLQLLATGMNEEQISKFLSISGRSVKQYISEAKIRLRCRTKVQAVAAAISQGYLKTV